MSANPLLDGIYLGGIGAGGVHLGLDGRFRQAGINNNRLPETRIPFLENSFLALYVGGEQPYARVLQTQSRQGCDVPLERLAPSHMLGRATYPRIDWQLTDPDCPVRIQWAAFAPVLPYDYQASILPAFVAAIQVVNTTADPVSISAAFCWDNACSREGAAPYVQGAAVSPMVAEEEKSGPEEEKLPTSPNALLFTSPKSDRGSASGHYCLAAHFDEEFQYDAWYGEPNGEEWRDAWQYFGRGGDFGAAGSGDPARVGALAAQRPIDPGQQVVAVFALSWYAPRLTAGEADIGNGYTNSYRGAADVAVKALHHREYFIKSVSNWRRRVLEGTLPRPLCQELLGTLERFTTHSYYTRDGRYATAAHDDADGAGELDGRYFGSFGALLFFPRFEGSEMSAHAERLEQHPDHVPLPLFSLRKGRQTRRSSALLSAAHFVLCACRNYLFTGELARLQKVYPAVREVVQWVNTHSNTKDVLPEGLAGDAQGLTAEEAGLWAAALEGAALLGRWRGDAQFSTMCGNLAPRAAQAFQHGWWDAASQRFRRYRGSQPPHPIDAAAFSGPWIAAMLHWGDLFEADVVRDAVAAAEKAFAEGLAARDLASDRACALACLMIRHGAVRPGLEFFHRHLQAREGRGRGAVDLASWHVLYALEGLLLDAPGHTLWLAPALPEGVHSLRFPVATPMGLGRMYFVERTDDGYLQAATLELDCPLHLRRIMLRIPRGVDQVEVSCTTPEEAVPISCNTVERGPHRMLRIRPEHDITGASQVTLRVNARWNGI